MLECAVCTDTPQDVCAIHSTTMLTRVIILSGRRSWPDLSECLCSLNVYFLVRFLICRKTFPVTLHPDSPQFMPNFAILLNQTRQSHGRYWPEDILHLHIYSDKDFLLLSSSFAYFYYSVMRFIFLIWCNQLIFSSFFTSLSRPMPGVVFLLCLTVLVLSEQCCA